MLDPFCWFVLCNREAWATAHASFHERRSTMELTSPVLARVQALVAPVASDLGLDIYDIEQRGGTLRITLDTPGGSPGGVNLDDLSLASRLISRALDEDDPVPGRYTLEVTSPGVERSLRTPAHFRRATGKEVAIRLADVTADERRLTGTIVAAADDAVTVRIAGLDGDVERRLAYDQIDRARMVFQWPATAKGQRPATAKGERPATAKGQRPATEKQGGKKQQTTPSPTRTNKEHSS
jgi:ribosome maturation factor RimP